jgi:N6-L-threonylcarbamoyladenine synthase
MLILGIETSCDETSTAIVKDGKDILALETFSQIEIHKLYDGVVPEVASRNHIIKIMPILKKTFASAKCSYDDIDVIAVSNRPGLIGSLLVGINFAKGLSWSLNKPIVYINHIYAHIYSAFINNSIDFPVLALVISGGHTLLYKLNNFQDIILIGRTVDDAAGEALDKGAKLLGLGYPGGPVIEKLAKSGNNEFFKFPIPKIKKGNLHFSYSGLKTALLNYVKNLDSDTLKLQLNDIAASYQHSVMSQLLEVIKRALKETDINNLLICGGVSANEYLRNLFITDNKLKKLNVNIFFPEKFLCGDNAAMIAGFAFHKSHNIKYDANKLFENAYSRIVKKGSN